MVILIWNYCDHWIRVRILLKDKRRSLYHDCLVSMGFCMGCWDEFGDVIENDGVFEWRKRCEWKQTILAIAIRICSCFEWQIPGQSHRKRKERINEYLLIGANGRSRNCNRQTGYPPMTRREYLRLSISISVLSRITEPMYLKLQ